MAYWHLSTNGYTPGRLLSIFDRITNDGKHACVLQLLKVKIKHINVYNYRYISYNCIRYWIDGKQSITWALKT